MALYFIAAIGASAANIDTAVTTTYMPDNVFRIESGKWIVEAEVATSKDMSEKLGIAGTATHIVVPLRAGYFGLAQPSLWEWLAAKSAAKV